MNAKKDCVFLNECSFRMSLQCKNDCPDYEQDKQIARDNDTASIAEQSGPDYERLYHRACEEMNKLKYDNKLMNDFIVSKGMVMDGE